MFGLDLIWVNHDTFCVIMIGLYFVFTIIYFS